MTVKELISELEKLPQDKKVILRHDDHTDWMYTTELTSELIYEDEWFDELKDEDEDEGEDVVMINCLFW